MKRLRPVVFLVCALVLGLIPRLSLAAPGDISTFAGGGAGDWSVATAGCVHNPGGVAVDGAGNIYIADQYNNRVRKVAAGTGIITTVAGNGVWGYSGDNGPATAAMLKEPRGVAVDAAGNLYIADTTNGRIRKVAAGTGIITTVAGTGNQTYVLGDGGPATAAELYYPMDVIVDRAGNLIIADRDSHRVRRVDAVTGIITSVAGAFGSGYSGDDGPATEASLCQPSGVALDSAGNLYIADTCNNTVRMVAAGTGIITTVVGIGANGYYGDGGAATGAMLNAPMGVSVDGSGNLFIADTNNNRVRKVANGIITTVAGNGTKTYAGDNGAAIQASLNAPSCVVPDGAGNLYIADTMNNRVRKVAGGTITTAAGNGTTSYAGDSGAATLATIAAANGVATDSAGNVYIADTYNNRVRKVAAGTGIITTVAGNGVYGYSGDNGAATAAMLRAPTGVAVDGSGNLYIADRENSRIRKVAAGTGIITTVTGKGVGFFMGDGGPATNAYVDEPYGVAVDSAGNLYIADTGNERVRKVAAGTGIITTVAGTGDYGYTGDNGPATAATFRTLNGIAVDSAGNLYIADQFNSCIRKVTVATGIITTVAGGTWGYAGDSGPATAASMINPYGVAVDGAGNLYIAENGNHVIRKVTAATGIITTVAGNGVYGYSGDNGPAIAATLGYPTGVAVDGAGNVYIADRDNDRIRKIAGNTSNLQYSLSLGFAGTGGGSVNSSPAGIACTSATCTASFAGGEVVTLMPTPDADSLFGGWSGACIATSGPCTLTMNADLAATATFTYIKPARLDGPTPVYFSLLQAAYDGATPYATIQARAVSFVENLLLNQNMAVTLKGGYDTSYGANEGFTLLQGTLTVGRGQLVGERLEIQ